MKWILFIAFCLFAWFYACVYGTLPDEVIPEGDPQELTDSCVLQDIDSPNFRAFWSIGRIDTVPEYARVRIGIYTDYWIKDYEEVRPLSEVVRELVSNYVTSSQLVSIDHAGIVGNQLVIDCFYAFANPGGNMAQQPRLQLELPGYVGSWGFGLQDNKNLMIGTLANYGASDVVKVIEALPSWQRFRMKWTNLSQDDKALIYDALLADCKCCARIDTQSLNIPQNYIDQMVYQNMTLQ